MPRKILFVCLGNICRSPIAEGIFIHLCQERGLTSAYRVDSAGTGGWHIGQPPDKRSTVAAKKHGVHLPSICRQVRASDFLEFDLIIGMDSSNLADLLADCPPQFQQKIKLMRDYDPHDDKNLDVPDPYHGGTAEFNAVYDMLLIACTGLLDSLRTDSKQA